MSGKLPDREPAQPSALVYVGVAFIKVLNDKNCHRRLLFNAASYLAKESSLSLSADDDDSMLQSSSSSL